MTLQAVEFYSVCFCIIKSLKRVNIFFIFILKEVLCQLIYQYLCIRLIIGESVYFAVDDVA